MKYIIVHEMVHLRERQHNDRFIAYMDKFMPQWKLLPDSLTRLLWGMQRGNISLNTERTRPIRRR